MIAYGIPLDEALKRLEAQLVADGKPQFVPLVTKEALKEAIRTALAAYPRPGSDVVHYLRTCVKPLLDRITNDGVWPDEVQLDLFYETKPDDNGITHTGLGLSVEIWTPDEAFKGFSLPLLDVWYGRWVESAE